MVRECIARFRGNRYECLRGIWKSMAVPSIMYGMIVIKWTKCELKLEVIQNKVGRMVLEATRYVGVEAIRGGMGWSLFDERVTKSVVIYKVRMESMSNDGLPNKVYLWNSRKSPWEEECKLKLTRCGLQCVRSRLNGGAFG